MKLIWSNEANEAYHRTGGGAPRYLTDEQQLRWHRLRMARLLFEGRHSAYYLGEGRTQFDYPKVRVQDREVQLYVTFNLLKLVSVKTADLLFGAKAKLDAPTAQQTDRLDELARRSKLHARLHAAAVQASWAGGAFLEALLFNGEAYVEVVPPDEIYPVGPRQPDDQYARYVRFATANVGTAERPVILLLETTYEPGAIRRTLTQLGEDGATRKQRLTLDNWPAFRGGAAGGEVPPDEVRTGVADNTITYLPNEAGGVLEASDYDGLVELQDAVNAKFAQVARVLAKHSDPKLAAPAAAADERGGLPSNHDVFWYRSKEEVPTYITWSAELDAAMRDRESAVDALCTAAEMSQVLLGIRKGATPDAARKLRLEATNSLAKVGRKALNVEPAIARCVETAQRLDQTSSLLRSYPVDPVGVEMRDGLPVDELDEANVIASLRSAGVMSLEDAVERRKEDPDAAAAEVARLRDEQAAATPSVLLGTNAGVEPGEQPPAAAPVEEVIA